MDLARVKPVLIAIPYAFVAHILSIVLMVPVYSVVVFLTMMIGVFFLWLNWVPILCFCAWAERRQNAQVGPVFTVFLLMWFVPAMAIQLHVRVQMHATKLEFEQNVADIRMADFESLPRAYTVINSALNWPEQVELTELMAGHIDQVVRVSGRNSAPVFEHSGEHVNLTGVFSFVAKRLEPKPVAECEPDDFTSAQLKLFHRDPSLPFCVSWEDVDPTATELWPREVFASFRSQDRLSRGSLHGRIISDLDEGDGWLGDPERAPEFRIAVDMDSYNGRWKREFLSPMPLPIVTTVRWNGSPEDDVPGLYIPGLRSSVVSSNQYDRDVWVDIFKQSRDLNQGLPFHVYRFLRSDKLPRNRTGARYLEDRRTAILKRFGDYDLDWARAQIEKAPENIALIEERSGRLFPDDVKARIVEKGLALCFVGTCSDILLERAIAGAVSKPVLFQLSLLDVIDHLPNNEREGALEALRGQIETVEALPGGIGGDHPILARLAAAE